MTIAGTLKQRIKSVVGKKPDPREQVHFLHIGKCAGTAIMDVAAMLEETSPDMRIIYSGHDTYLMDIPETDRYFFGVRDPITRFRSGFYSRKRRGRPQYDYHWTQGEALAFANFEHANDLAEALFAQGETGRRAFMAMKSIRHCSQNQVDWFSRAGDLFVNRPPVWILRQEHFAADFAVLCGRLGLDFDAVYAKQNAGGANSHANDYTGAPPLSDLAKANLARWYAPDFELYAMCENWIGEQQAQADVSG